MQITSILAFVAAFAAATVSAVPRGVERPATTVRGINWKSDYHCPHKRALGRRAISANYGGPVIPNVEVHTIFYGAANYQSQINSFYSGITNSDYIAWLSEYNTPSQKIGTGTFGGSYTQTGTLKSSLDDVKDIQPYLKTLVSTGVIKPNANTYYAIHFGPGISITQGTIDISSSNTKYLYYGVIPDQGGACAGGCGSSSSTLNNLCSVSSHELIEAITDAAVGVASANAAPLAWYDATNGEIADICNGQQATVTGGDGVTYSVQAQWSNSQNACIVSKAGVHPVSSTTTKTTTTTKATTTTTTTSCAHSICSAGVKLTSTCDTCAAKIIAQDSYCGSTTWDSICVGEVKSICGITC
ncbi:hypothetical protein HDU76_004298 [Blyttiomyces sp. JEL0837]|nr:hypothetical protein HDU76_004298 [Blyttiomyces sp. JEL0837]